eukprot:3350254-Prymnesium_polylepis.2
MGGGVCSSSRPLPASEGRDEAGHVQGDGRRQPARIVEVEDWRRLLEALDDRKRNVPQRRVPEVAHKEHPHQLPVAALEGEQVYLRVHELVAHQAALEELLLGQLCHEALGVGHRRRVCDQVAVQGEAARRIEGHDAEVVLRGRKREQRLPTEEGVPVVVGTRGLSPLDCPTQLRGNLLVVVVVLDHAARQEDVCARIYHTPSLDEDTSSTLYRGGHIGLQRLKEARRLRLRRVCWARTTSRVGVDLRVGSSRTRDRSRRSPDGRHLRLNCLGG